MPPLSCARRPFLLTLLASALLSARAQSPDASAYFAAEVDRAFRPLMAEHDIPGMALGVTFEGRRYVSYFGVASKESDAPVTQDTLFEIGSLSKVFTATLAGYAQAQGKLTLNDTPGRHMKELRGSAIDQASLLQLGTYAAGGLPLQFPDDVDDLARAAAYFRQWTPDSPPGEQRRYSNPSIGLLGHVTALAMQRSFDGLIEEELFRALELSHTFIRVPPRALPAYAWGYNKANQATRVNPGVFDAQAYGVKTTLGDMLQFVEANIQPHALQPALRRAVEGTHVGYYRVGDMVQGLGWEQYPYPVPVQALLAGNSSVMALRPHRAEKVAPSPATKAATLFNKTGSTNGFGAYAAFVPARRVGIVMLANRNIPNAVRIAAAHSVLEKLTGGR